MIGGLITSIGATKLRSIQAKEGNSLKAKAVAGTALAALSGLTLVNARNIYRSAQDIHYTNGYDARQKEAKKLKKRK